MQVQSSFSLSSSSSSDMEMLEVLAASARLTVAMQEASLSSSNKPSSIRLLRSSSFRSEVKEVVEIELERRLVPDRLRLLVPFESVKLLRLRPS